MSTAGIAERREKLNKGAVGREATLARDSADAYIERGGGKEQTKRRSECGKVVVWVRRWWRKDLDSTHEDGEGG